MSFSRQMLTLLFVVLSFFNANSTVFAAEQCAQLFTYKTSGHVRLNKDSKNILLKKEQPLNDRTATVELLARFAADHKLPYRWHEFGPADRKVKRLVVAIDINDQSVMKAYRELFNINQQTIKGDKNSGTLVIEQTWEDPNKPEHYVYTYIRASSDENESVYRWGKKDLNWTTSFQSIKDNVRNKKGLIGFGHLIELNSAEAQNVKIFLDNPDQRGPCKSTNCVAWLTGTELGKTSKTATEEERQYLFTELGISRTIAPFEISRRLVHASNERHGAMVAFVNGSLGIESFNKEFDLNLIPEPKIPYANILKNYKTPNPAENAISHINDGEKIFIPIAAGASPEAIDALIERSQKLDQGIDVHMLVNGISAQTLRKGVETTDGKFRVHALFLGGNLRELHREKKVSVIPGNLSDFTRIMRDQTQNQFHYDTIVVRVSPANEQGFHSLGPNHDMIMTILRDRPNIKIIAEVNPNIPFTRGDNIIHQSKITAKFNSKTELAGPTTIPANEVDTKIGTYLGQLIDSGATLQIGIGNIFGAVPDGLKKAGKSNIKISTEMFGDHMMQMMNDGIATTAEAGFAFGSGNLYKWLNNNEKVKFVATEYVNSPGRVAQTQNFHAVNTALQVDLFGQVNATMGPDGRISSPGGQIEFMSGAARSEGGKAIIAIRSTAKNETISSITLNLYKGPITTPHESVTHVVTEYGIAELRGKNEQQRAISLINIAHPKFRKQLAEEALDAGIITAQNLNQVIL